MIKRGDRVISTAIWHSQKAGTVSRPGRGVSIMVRWDGGNNDERVLLVDLRIETLSDVAKREHEAALRVWRHRRPQTTVAHVDLDSRWGSNDEIGATASANTPSAMLQAADDFRVLAGWFAARPSASDALEVERKRRMHCILEDAAVDGVEAAKAVAPPAEAMTCLAWCPDHDDESAARAYVGTTPGEVAEQQAEHVYNELGTEREFYDVRVRVTKGDRVLEWDVTVNVEAEVTFSAALAFPRQALRKPAESSQPADPDPVGVDGGRP